MNSTHDLQHVLLKTHAPANLGFILLLSMLLTACKKTPQQTIDFSWDKVNTNLVPTARMDAAMATDEATGRIYMFGGRSKSGCLGDLWYFTTQNDQGWHQVSSDGGPSPRSGASMVIEPKSGRLVLFGGYCSNVEGGLDFNKEIWIFSDEQGWSRQYTRGGPAPRAWQSMSMDEYGSVLIFGGVSPPPSYHRNDLWKLDLAQMQWSRIANDGGPLMAGRGALLSCERHPLTVSGKMGIRKAKTSGTFRLEKMSWKKVHASHDQIPPASFQLAFSDKHTRSVLLLRGPDEHSTEISWDLWMLKEPWNDESKWLYGHSNTGPRFALGMSCSAYPGNKGLICFGGARQAEFSNETWRLEIGKQRGVN